MEILIRLLLGFAGVLVHCLKNFDSLKKDAKAIKIQFSVRDYFESDWLSISLSLIAVLVWPFIFDEAANRYAYLEGWVNTSFAAVGLLGSYGIQMLLGRGRSAIRAMASETADKAVILEDIINNLQADSSEDGDPIPPKGPKG